MFKILLIMAMMLAFPAFAADVSQPVDDILKVEEPAAVDTVIPVSDPERPVDVTGETTQKTRTLMATADRMNSGHERSHSPTGEITQHVLATAYHLPFEVAWDLRPDI